ncbi:MAG: hypothetical protein C5B54_09125 [Acidobacteria bacterium]|nr:MAG: hypothetical protein C5B54_09125 [Acidobacteriota bacterium]
MIDDLSRTALDRAMAAGYLFVRKATVTLTHAQILRLPSGWSDPTYAVVLVPAVPDHRIWPLMTFSSSSGCAAHPYTNINGGSLVVGQDSASMIWLGVTDATELLTADNYVIATYPWASTSGGSGARTFEQRLITPDNNLYLSSDNGDDFTGGDPENTLTITVAYVVI